MDNLDKFRQSLPGNTVSSVKNLLICLARLFKIVLTKKSLSVEEYLDCLDGFLLTNNLDNLHQEIWFNMSKKILICLDILFIIV